MLKINSQDILRGEKCRGLLNNLWNSTKVTKLATSNLRGYLDRKYIYHH